MPATTPLSDAISKDLRGRGFSFVGSTICYSYMQAVGLVDDHIITCFIEPAVVPARTYEEALQRVAAFQSYDDDRILPQARTALLSHGARTPLAVVLLHGFTNHPGQYRAFAPRLFDRGVNVLVPRMPEQGDRDRMTQRLAKLTAEALLARASEAVDVACGLGERVASPEYRQAVCFAATSDSIARTSRGRFRFRRSLPS